MSNEREGAAVKALCFGIDKYDSPEWENLKNCGSDARSFAKKIEGLEGQCTARVLTDSRLEIKKMRVEEARRAEEEHKDGAKQQLLGVKLEVRRLWEQSGAQTADVGSFLAQIVLNCDADENVVRMYVAGKKVGRSRRRCAHRMGV